MITKEKLNIYKKYDGDDNEIFLYGKDFEKQVFDKNEDWGIIADLIQGIILIDNNQVSADLRQKTLKQIELNVEKDSFDLLYKIARHNKKSRNFNLLDKIKTFLNI